MTLEFRVWHESGELIGEFDNKADAVARVEKARAECACGTDGQEETPGKGNFKCGVMNPHGISLQIVQDGQDVTGSDYGQWD